MLTDKYDRLYSGTMPPGPTSWLTYVAPDSKAVIVSSIHLRLSSPGIPEFVNISINQKVLYSNIEVTYEGSPLDGLNFILQETETLEINKVSGQQAIYFSIFGLISNSANYISSVDSFQQQETVFIAEKNTIVNSIAICNNSTQAASVSLAIVDGANPISGNRSYINGDDSLLGLIYSDDGSTWNIVTDLLPNYQVSPPFYGGYNFYVFYSNTFKKYFAASYSFKVFVSDDGINWDLSLNASSTQDGGTGTFAAFVSVLEKDGYVYCFGVQPEMYRTFDGGSSWDYFTTNEYVNRVLLKDGTFYGLQSYRLVKSVDGISWTPVIIPQTGSSNISMFLLNNKIFVTQWGGSNKLLYSDDGQNFTVVTLPITNAKVIEYTGTRYIVAGYGGNVAYSNDLVTWTSQNIGFGDNFAESILYNNGIVTISVESNSNLYVSSDHGTSWTSVPGPSYYNDDYGTIMYFAGGGAYNGGNVVPKVVPIVVEPKDYILKSLTVLPTETVLIKSGYTLSAGNGVVASSTESVNIGIFGAEI